MPSVELTLFGTEGCHLCDDVQDMLEEIWRQNPGIDQHVCVRNQDIALDDALFAEMGEQIPVLEIRSAEHACALHWPFDEPAIIDLINTALQRSHGQHS